jgi:hypothetical protein
VDNVLLTSHSSRTNNSWLFAPSSLILANYYLPLNGALAVQEIMALDLHIMENGQAKEWIYAIDSEKWVLFNEAFEKFAAKSGLVIDEYSDTKFSSGLQNLIDVIKSVAPEYGKNSVVFTEFISVLESAESNSKSVIFVGD